MTVREAIYRLKDHFGVHYDGRPTPYLDKAVSLAYEALEKQIPKKPNLSGDSCDEDGNLIYDTYDCPNCHTNYEMDYEKYDYCPSCGQALDWSEEVNENEQNQNRMV